MAQTFLKGGPGCSPTGVVAKPQQAKRSIKRTNYTRRLSVSNRSATNLITGSAIRSK